MFGFCDYHDFDAMIKMSDHWIALYSLNGQPLVETVKIKNQT